MAANTFAGALQGLLLAGNGPAPEPRGDLSLRDTPPFFAVVTSVTASPPSISFDVYQWLGNGSEVTPWARNRFVHVQRAPVHPDAVIILEPMSARPGDKAFGAPDEAGLVVVSFADFARRFPGQTAKFAASFWISTDAGGVNTMAQLYQP